MVKMIRALAWRRTTRGYLDLLADEVIVGDRLPDCSFINMICAQSLSRTTKHARIESEVIKIL